ncbi:MAG: FabA-like domain protein [Opitutae bacterium]|nr:FabA-like domain protein [Opitutae bacterium]
MLETSFPCIPQGYNHETVTTAQQSTLSLEDIKETLKRCPEGTFDAVVAFREDQNPEQVPVIVMGIIERHLEAEQKEVLRSGGDEIRLYEDLGVDSLTMLEIVMMTEQTLELSLDNEELKDLRTIGDVKVYIDCKIKGEEPPSREKTYRIEEIASVMPHQDPFLFLESATLNGDVATGIYNISGTEGFMEGHFKNNPVFPASIMIEALGQLGVFYLLKGENPLFEGPIRPDSIFFTSCDGVRCRRVCKPGEKLELTIKPKQIRHPMAVFDGLIRVGDQKAASAEEIKLTFDYFPKLDVTGGDSAE